MDETFMLILLSVFMLIASYLAGSIPLVVSLSEDKLQLVTVFGAGLLVGTALAVIIPEGISSLVSSVNVPHKGGEGTESSHGHVEDIHSIIGVSLVIGFVIMLLIDQISARHTRGDIEGGKAGPKITATIGLVVHSAVDGVALGAAASTAHHDVEFIVFLAIMLHKAPAAFGLVSFLMHEGLERKRIRKHLMIFSLAAPLLALITFFFIGPEGKEKLSSMNMTGVAMLFSAGTFLYVAAVHVLPELTARAGGSLKALPLTTLVFGACLPLLLASHHHH